MAQAEGRQKVLSGDVVFLLHDTHGFPWDLTQIIARERGFDVDLDRYEQLMEAQRQRGDLRRLGREGGGGPLARRSQARLGETDVPRLRGRRARGRGHGGGAGEGRARGPRAPRRRPGRAAHRPHPVLRRVRRPGGRHRRASSGTAARPRPRCSTRSRPVPGLVVHEVQVTSGTLRGRGHGAALGRRAAAERHPRQPLGDPPAAPGAEDRARRPREAGRLGGRARLPALRLLALLAAHAPSSWSRSRTWSTAGSATTPTPRPR